MDPTEEPATCQVLGRLRSLSMGSITRRGAIDSSQPRGINPAHHQKLPGESKPLPHALSLGDGLDREKRDGGCFRLQSEGAWASAGPCERLRSSLSTLFLKLVLRSLGGAVVLSLRLLWGGAPVKTESLKVMVSSFLHTRGKGVTD